MHTRHRRLTLQRGFTLIEILTVLAIIGILAAILIPAVAKAQERTRLTAALAEIRSLRVIVSEAASRLGGTLPITEGLASTPRSTQIAFSAAPAATVPATLTAAQRNGVTASRLLRLDHVLLGLKPPLLENTWTTRFGGGVAPTPLRQPPILFNPDTQRFADRTRVNAGNPPGTTTYNLDGVNAADDASNLSRIECAALVARTAFNIANANLSDVNVARGINFDLDGNGLVEINASVLAYVVYKRVAQQDAYRLAAELNGTRLMDNTTPDGDNAQVRGSVIYAAPTGGVVDVYVFLAQF